jgi:hypothetical protein
MYVPAEMVARTTPTMIMTGAPSATPATTNPIPAAIVTLKYAKGNPRTVPRSYTGENDRSQ